MKKEFTIILGFIIFGAIIVTLFTLPVVENNKTIPKKLIGEVKTLKVGENQFTCKDATRVQVEYTYPISGDSIRSKRNAMISVRNFALTKDSDYFYNLKVPHKLNNGMMIFKATLEARVLTRYKERDKAEIERREADSIVKEAKSEAKIESEKFINTLINEIKKDGWTIKNGDSRDFYIISKGDFGIIVNAMPMLGFAKVVYKGKGVILTEKEEAMIIATVLIKVKTAEHEENSNTRKEILEKFGK